MEIPRQNKVYIDASVEVDGRKSGSSAYPGLVSIHVVVEDERVDKARCRVDAVEHRYDQRGVVDLESSIETDDLRHGRHSQENESDDARWMSELTTGSPSSALRKLANELDSPYLTSAGFAACPSRREFHAR